jgi:hypothetical protein
VVLGSVAMRRPTSSWAVTATTTSTSTHRHDDRRGAGGWPVGGVDVRDGGSGGGGGTSGISPQCRPV